MLNGIAIELRMNNKNDSIVKRIHDFYMKHDVMFFSLFMISLSLFAYRAYIFGERLFVFNDGAKDSIWQVYPYLLYAARCISNGTIGEIVNFSEGLGYSSYDTTFSLFNWVCYFGEKNVAYLMGVSQVIKVALSGIIAYCLAKLRGCEKVGAFFVGIGYGFCAHIIIRQEFKTYGIEALVVIMWICLFELFYIKKNFYFLPLVTWLCFYHFGEYLSLLWTLIFSAYIIFHYLIDDKKIYSWAGLIKQEAIFIISILLIYGTDFVNIIRKSTGSTRFQNTVSNIKDSADAVLNHERRNGLLNYYLRTIGMSINGTAEKYFSGEHSYLVDGAMYCGIFVFLCVPIFIFLIKKQKRIWYILGYICVGLYVFLPKLRYLINGYGCPGFRLSSLWIIILMLLTFIDGFNALYLSDGFKSYEKMMVIATLLVNVLIMVAALPSGYVQSNWFWGLSFVLILINGGLLLVGTIKPDKMPLLIKGAVCVLVVEVLMVSNEYINGRQTLYKDIDKTVATYGTGIYEDGTKDAVDYIESIDNDWYRIDKCYESSHLCDPLAQGYKGTISYIGGLGAGEGFHYLCRELGFNKRGTDLVYGPMGNVYLSSLISSKYILTKNNHISQYGCTYIGTVDGINIYRNDLALPVAYVYDQAVDIDSVEDLSYWEKQRLILKACISDSEVLEKMRIQADVSEVQDLYDSIIKDNENANIGDLTVLTYKPDGTDTLFIYAEDADGESIRSGVMEGDGEEVRAELFGMYKDITASDCNIDKYPPPEPLDYMSCIRVDADKYYEDTVHDIKKLQKSGLTIEHFDESSIVGTIDTDYDGVFATSIPYLDEWEIKIDGEKMDTYVVNYDFLGSDILKGHHEVEIRFPTNNSFISVYSKLLITLVKLVILAVICFIVDSYYNRKSGRLNE